MIEKLTGPQMVHKSGFKRLRLMVQQNKGINARPQQRVKFEGFSWCG